MKLAYFGADEAGYGPVLGPLCIALTGVEVDNWTPGEPPPDLWDRLKTALCREARQALKSGRLAIDDSKKLKRPNDSRGLHPLAHLERGVLGFLHVISEVDRSVPASGSPHADEHLLAALGAEPPVAPWYAGDSIALPLSTTPDHIRLLGANLGRACDAAGVRPLPMAARMVGEAPFNSDYRRLGSKAAVSFARVGELLRAVWIAHAGRLDLDDHGPRVVVDRQGGRTTYAEVLAPFFPAANIRAIEERAERCRYVIAGEERRMLVSFEVEAESRHLPVALASMAAKLTRELAMLRFNRYWGSRIPELKPTAGYALDARRWLLDVARVITDDERRALVRLA